MGRSSFTTIATRRKHPRRPRDRVRVPQPDRRRGNRGSRSESRDGPRVGEATGVRARLRARRQPRGAAPHDRVRDAAFAEPRASRRSEVRRRKGDQRRLGFASDADARRYAGDDRRRPGERRSECEPARSAALRRRRDDVQADDRGCGERDLRRDRRQDPASAVQIRPSAGRDQGEERVTRHALR